MLPQTRNNHFSERLSYADSLPQAAHITRSKYAISDCANGKAKYAIGDCTITQI